MKEEKPVTETNETETEGGRREFIKKSVYAAPAILTLTAIPSFANTGSNKRKPMKRKNSKGKKGKKGKWKKGKKKWGKGKKHKSKKGKNNKGKKGKKGKGR